MFIRNKFKAKKLTGGLGSITEFGSTISIKESCKCKPFISGEYICTPMTETKRNRILNEIYKISKNPLNELRKYLHIPTNNHLFPTELKSDRELYNYFQSSDEPVDIDKIIYIMLFGINNIKEFLKDDAIFIEDDDRFKEIIGLQKNIDEILSKINFAQPNKIMQGNTPTYTYNENGIGYGYNYGFDNENFRKWFNKDDGNIFINVYPDSSNKLIDKIENRKTDDSGKRFGIADIYPAAVNSKVTFLLYIKCIEKSIDENKIKAMVALHILETYILNAYGRFAHHTSYNSSISDNFSFI